MKRHSTSLLLVILFVSASFAGCLFDDSDDKQADLSAVFNYSPSTNIQEGQTITFNATGSLPDDGTLTYRWDFDGDAAVDDTGRTATWSYSVAGDYVVTLTVTDGGGDDQLSKTITILGADIAVPTADAGNEWPEENCDGEDAPSQQSMDKYLVIICENKEINDRSIEATVTINLDASGSTPGADSAYLTNWIWDLNTKDDSDGDGTLDNDEDASGETFQWTGIEPGEYELALMVTNSDGISDSVTFKVYVSYVGTWEDFEQPGNTSAGSSGSPGETWFDFTVTYDSDSGNTIRRAEWWITYPKEDSDWVVGGGSDQNRNRLEIYVFNETDDEVTNTSGVQLEGRTYGDCSEENDCIEWSVSGSRMRSEFGDGPWTAKIHNDRLNDVQVVQFRIFLTYK